MRFRVRGFGLRVSGFDVRACPRSAVKLRLGMVAQGGVARLGKAATNPNPQTSTLGALQAPMPQTPKPREPQSFRALQLQSPRGFRVLGF